MVIHLEMGKILEHGKKIEEWGVFILNLYIQSYIAEMIVQTEVKNDTKG